MGAGPLPPVRGSMRSPVVRAHEGMGSDPGHRRDESRVNSLDHGGIGEEGRGPVGREPEVARSVFDERRLRRRPAEDRLLHADVGVLAGLGA